MTQELLQTESATEKSPTLLDGFHVHRWIIDSSDDCGVLVILRKGKPLCADDLEFIEESLMIFADPLKRALDYEEIFAQARKDNLTGLPNRYVFEERIVV